MVAIGRVFGTNVMELRFRTEHSEDVQVGELLIIEDKGGATKYMVRVMDVEYGADADSDDWLVREAGTAMQRDKDNKKFDPEDMSDMIYRTGVCSPLGYLTGQEFRKVKSIPDHFSKVRRADGGDYEFLRPLMGDIEVGFLRSGDQILDFPVGISGRSFPHHVGIFATTGMGKSNLMKGLALSCMRERRYGFLIFDPHGEYYDGGEIGKKGLCHATAAKDGLVVFSSRKLEGPYTTLHVSSSEIEIDDLKNLYEFTGAQVECLQTAQYHYKDAWLMALRDKDVKTIVKDLQDKFQEGTVNVIKRRLDSIFQFDLVTTDRQLSITKNVLECLGNGKVVLVDTSNMFEAEELLISTVLTRAIFEQNKVKYSDKAKFDKQPPVLIAMEEAQRVLSQAKGTIFAQIAREGRKFKVGLCAVSQQPKLINEEIISQFNTLFILGLADKRDRDILRNSAKQDISMLENEIQMLMPGEALIASPFTPFAIPVKVHLYEEYLKRCNGVDDATRSRGAQPTPDKGFF